MKLPFIITLILLLSLATPVIADDTATSSSDTPEASQDSTVRRDLETLIQNTVKENLSSTEAELAEKVKENKLVGYVGDITAITAESLTLKSDGEIFQVGITKNTTYSKLNKTVKYDALAIGDKAIVMGLQPKKDILDAKRIVVVRDTPTVLPKVLSGEITDIDKAHRTISFKANGTVMPLVLSRHANLYLSDFKVGKKAVVITHSENADLVITLGKIF